MSSTDGLTKRFARVTGERFSWGDIGGLISLGVIGEVSLSGGRGGGSFENVFGTFVPFLKSSETPLFTGVVEHLFQVEWNTCSICSIFFFEYWFPLCRLPASDRFALMDLIRLLSLSISFLKMVNASPAVVSSSVSVPDKPYSMIASYTSSLTFAGNPVRTFFQCS